MPRNKNMTPKENFVVKLAPLVLPGLSIIPETCMLLFLAMPAPYTEAAQVLLRGAGASFPKEVYDEWIPRYKAHRETHVDLHMTYKAVGSGEGKRKIIANSDDLEYAGSDSVLSTADRRKRSDLVMFPTMAGGAVLAYNVPECGSALNLTRDHVVGIYNGTYRLWNDTSLQNVNSCKLPGERILVLARRDKSGTTSMFTEALSSFSEQWKQKYGVFSSGVDANTDMPYVWNSSVFYLYGTSNVGMSALVQSVRHSIGYVSVSAAKASNLTYAYIQNRYGQFVKPSTKAIQMAMDSRDSGNLTVSLADADGEGVYPIASYTYFIIYFTQMKNCQSAKELVRYVSWFMEGESARSVCEHKEMVPLSRKIRDSVQREVLSQVTCRGQNVWRAVLDDRAQEGKTEESWVLAVAISVPLVSLVILALLAYALWQRYKLLRMIDSDEWDIPIEDIVFFEDRQRFSGAGVHRINSMVSEKSFVSVSDIPDGVEILSQILQWPGKWKGNTVGVRMLQVKELQQVSRAVKKTMLWMRDTVVHANLVRFYGLTEVESERYVIGEYCAKGSMVDILQNDKYNFNNDFKFSLAADIASGMAFLHANGVVHGSLTSSCCLLDARWTVKIGDWEYCRLLTDLQSKKNSLLLLLEQDQEDKNSYATAFRHFWVSPEILRSEFTLAVANSTDMYSFGIILQEIYTREDPYAELADTLTPQQVVRAVCNNNLRPQPNDDIPIRVRQMMEIAWSDNPISRPSFEQMLKMLRQSRSSRKSLLDSMMETMEEYTHHLEEQVAGRSAEVAFAKRKLEAFLVSSVPQQYVTLFVNNDITKLGSEMTVGVQGREYAHLGVVMVEMVGVDAALLHGRPEDVVTVLQDLCTGVDEVAGRYGAFRSGTAGESQIILVGLESETTFLDQRCADVSSLALDLLHFVTNMAPPLTSQSPTSSLSMRAGVNVGKVVTGMMVVGAAPKFVTLGEGVAVAKALMRSSQACRVRVSRNVFSHLEKNLNFVLEEAGWIECVDMEVESFWIRHTVTKATNSVPSDHSADSGIEVDRPHHDSQAGDSYVPPATSDAFKDTVGDGARPKEEGDVYQRMFQIQLQGRSPSQNRQQHQRQMMQTLSDITEEDERQNSPRLHHHQHQPLTRQRHVDQPPQYLYSPVLRGEHTSVPTETPQKQGEDFVHRTPTVHVINTTHNSQRQLHVTGGNSSVIDSSTVQSHHKTFVPGGDSSTTDQSHQRLCTVGGDSLVIDNNSIQSHQQTCAGGGDRVPSNTTLAVTDGGHVGSAPVICESPLTRDSTSPGVDTKQFIPVSTYSSTSSHLTSQRSISESVHQSAPGGSADGTHQILPGHPGFAVSALTSNRSSQSANTDTVVYINTHSPRDDSTHWQMHNTDSPRYNSHSPSQNTNPQVSSSAHSHSLRHTDAHSPSQNNMDTHSPLHSPHTLTHPSTHSPLHRTDDKEVANAHSPIHMYTHSPKHFHVHSPSHTNALSEEIRTPVHTNTQFPQHTSRNAGHEQTQQSSAGHEQTQQSSAGHEQTQVSSATRPEPHTEDHVTLPQYTECLHPRQNKTKPFSGSQLPSQSVCLEMEEMSAHDKPKTDPSSLSPSQSPSTVATTSFTLPNTFTSLLFPMRITSRRHSSGPTDSLQNQDTRKASQNTMENDSSLCPNSDEQPTSDLEENAKKKRTKEKRSRKKSSSSRSKRRPSRSLSSGSLAGRAKVSNKVHPSQSHQTDVQQDS